MYLYPSRLRFALKDPVKIASSEGPSRQNSAAAAALSPAKRAQPAARSSAKRRGGGVEQESHEVTAIVVLEYKPPAEHTLPDLKTRRCGTYCLVNVGSVD